MRDQCYRASWLSNLPFARRTQVQGRQLGGQNIFAKKTDPSSHLCDSVLIGKPTGNTESNDFQWKDANDSTVSVSYSFPFWEVPKNPKPELKEETMVTLTTNFEKKDGTIGNSNENNQEELEKLTKCLKLDAKEPRYKSIFVQDVSGSVNPDILILHDEVVTFVTQVMKQLHEGIHIGHDFFIAATYIVKKKLLKDADTVAIILNATKVVSQYISEQVRISHSIPDLSSIFNGLGITTGFSRWITGVYSIDKETSSGFEDVDGRRPELPYFELLFELYNENKDLKNKSHEEHVKYWLKNIYTIIVTIIQWWSNYENKIKQAFNGDEEYKECLVRMAIPSLFVYRGQT